MFILFAEHVNDNDDCMLGKLPTGIVVDRNWFGHVNDLMAFLVSCAVFGTSVDSLSSEIR